MWILCRVEKEGRSGGKIISLERLSKFKYGVPSRGPRNLLSRFTSRMSRHVLSIASLQRRLSSGKLHLIGRLEIISKSVCCCKLGCWLASVVKVGAPFIGCRVVRVDTTTVCVFAWLRCLVTTPTYISAQNPWIPPNILKIVVARTHFLIRYSSLWTILLFINVYCFGSVFLARAIHAFVHLLFRCPWL